MHKDRLKGATYDLNLELVKKKIKEELDNHAAFDSQSKHTSKTPLRVLIQLPAGLRIHVLEVANAVIEAGAEPLIWAGSCYGACDLPDYTKADLLIHLGHNEFKK